MAARVGRQPPVRSVNSRLCRNRDGNRKDRSPHSNRPSVISLIFSVVSLNTKRFDPIRSASPSDKTMPKSGTRENGQSLPIVSASAFHSLGNGASYPNVDVLILRNKSQFSARSLQFVRAGNSNEQV